MSRYLEYLGGFEERQSLLEPDGNIDGMFLGLIRHELRFRVW